MAIVNDDMKEDSVYSTLVETLNSNVGKDAPTPEDLAWADSCLNKDLNVPDSDWSSIKDALFEILSSQSGQLDSSASVMNSQVMVDKDVGSSENVMSLEFGRRSDEVEDLIEDDNEDIESIEYSDDEEDNLVLVGRRGRGRRSRIKSVFRPNYTEDIANVEVSNSGMDLSLTTFDVEPLSDDIFKVWDLGIPDDPNDLLEQLSKDFKEFPSPISETEDDSSPLKDIMQESMDNLIASIGDLSLKQNT